MRHHIYVMEGALARAVDYGAKQLNREILAVMPGVFMLEGEARARGVHLEGYGVFFDVRVPMMRQSMVWSLRMMLDQDDAANQAAINELRRSMQGVTDPDYARVDRDGRCGSSNARLPAAPCRAIQQVAPGCRRMPIVTPRSARGGDRHSASRPGAVPPPTACGRRIRTAPTPRP